MRILLFADIHIGSIKDTKYFYKTITDIIEKEIIFTHSDLIVILGDYFDKLFKDNDEYTSLAINIMSFLIRACIREDTKIRIIYGTESHEMNQYQLFNYHVTSNDIDFKIFDTVTEENINGVNILYVPEEYIDAKEKHYKEYLYSDKKYNFIFGHGIIIEGMPKASENNMDPNNKEKQVPRFKTGELSNASDICVFGHYHTFTDLGNNVYYLGSLFRDSFGEEDPKGYGIIDNKNGEYKFTFIENTEAIIYKTYSYEIDNSIYTDPNSIIKEINKIKEDNKELFSGDKKGKIKIKMNLPENISPAFRENLKNVLYNEKNITCIITENTSIINIDEDNPEEDDFILDNKIDLVDKIYKYITVTFTDPMTLEELNNYLEPSMNIIRHKNEIEE